MEECVLFHLLNCLRKCMKNIPYKNCVYNHLPEEEPKSFETFGISEILKIELKYYFEKCAFPSFMSHNYITMHGAKNIKTGDASHSL